MRACADPRRRLARIARLPGKALRKNNYELRQLMGDMLVESVPLLIRLIIFLAMTWMFYGALGMLWFGGCLGDASSPLTARQRCPHAGGPLADLTPVQLRDATDLEFFETRVDTLLNFNSFPYALGTLFALTIGNDLGIIMQGYSSVMGNPAFIYFALYWITFNVLFGQIVVAKVTRALLRCVLIFRHSCWTA
jgi:hypothetical protein